MTRNWWIKSLLLVFFVGLSALYVYPTLANLDLQKTKFPFKQKINLGLDLQGGLYMVLGIDFNKVYKDVIDQQSGRIQDRMAEKHIPIQNLKIVREGQPIDDPLIAFDFDAANKEQIRETLKTEFGQELRLARDSGNHFELGIEREHRGYIREHTMSQSIEVIRNRIDEFGVSEPSITSQGNDRVVVELPGVREVDRAKDLIGRTAKLEFKIVDDKAMNQGQVAALISSIEKENNFSYHERDKFSEYVDKVNQLAKGKIPADDEIAFERTKVQGQAETTRIPYLLHSRADATGADLSDAQVNLDPETRQPEVAFSMNPRGTALMEKLTGENVGKRMAIVLDNIVHSAPVIQSKIGAHGRITLGRGDSDDSMKEAKDLSIVLRAGALPAQLDFLEQRVVGPSLGQDSIHKGALASLVGSLAVFLFVGFYYRVSGMIAVASLLLNVLFVLASLVGLDATLTLPGIAGIALTVGIAVDSNVVIYERIREELRAGKRPHGAVEAGFQKAFRTIMDANVTNAAAAIVLLMYGTGPIKGFAVTLLIGIVTTLFTAVFVCKVIFDWYLHIAEERGAQTLSI